MNRPYAYNFEISKQIFNDTIKNMKPFHESSVTPYFDLKWS